MRYVVKEEIKTCPFIFNFNMYERQKKIMPGMLEVLLCHIALDIFGFGECFSFCGCYI